MRERQARNFLTSWTVVGCALEVIAPLTYIYLWDNKLSYQIMMAIGLILVTVRIILAGGIYLAAVNAARGKKPEPTTFMKFNTRQAKWSILAIFVLMALNMMFIHV